MAAQLAKDMPRAYLDLDVDDAYAKFKRASHFVESCDLKYAQSSKKIDELGGGEVLRLPELYSNDYEWTAKGAMQARPQPNCRVVFELYEDIAPLAVENFLALCRGDRGVDKGSGVKLHYAAVPCTASSAASSCKAATSSRATARAARAASVRNSRTRRRASA